MINLHIHKILMCLFFGTCVSEWRFNLIWSLNNLKCSNVPTT